MNNERVLEIYHGSFTPLRLLPLYFQFMGVWEENVAYFITEWRKR